MPIGYIRITVVAMLMFCFAMPLAAMQGQTVLLPTAASDGFIVKFKSTSSRASQQNTLATAGLKTVERFALTSGLSFVQTVTGQNKTNALSTLQQNPAIEYVEPNYLVQVEVVPNDPDFNRQYGLSNSGQNGGARNADISAPEAWDLTTGEGALIAVVDTGVDYNHPDLSSNIWINNGEVPNNGIDDDHNGYVDDIRGWDFANSDNDPMDDHGHGTHVSGIIAAQGNNGTGVAGVNWKASIMALKFMDGTGIGSTVNAIRAINYAVAMGARVSNNSWGGAGYSQALYDTIQAAAQKGHLVVAASGNDGVNNDDPNTPHYPSGYNLNNIISVAATDSSDNRAIFSNFGATTVDLGAPGVRIYSTLPGRSYQFMDGTSMAAPFVTGVAGLIISRLPDINIDTLVNAIINNTDPVSSMTGITTTGGRLNAFKALSSVTADIKISPNTANVGINDTLQFSAQGGTAPYQWSVNNTALAQIDSRGFFRALSAGKVQVNVIDASGFRSNTGDIVISDINISPNNADLIVGEVLQFSVSGGIAPYEWQTPPNGIGSIDRITGLFSALSSGVTEVSVRDSTGISKSSGSIRIVDIQPLMISPMRADLMPGETLAFRVSGGTAPYTWSVSDNLIASIDNAGVLIANQAGAVTVTVTDLSGNSVTSNAINISELAIVADNTTVRINETVNLIVKGGKPPYQWRVTNSNIANVDAEGILTAVNPGSIRVTIMDANGNIGRSQVILITNSAALNVFVRDNVISVNGTTTIKVSGGTPPYNWTNSNPSVVRVDENTGTVTGLRTGNAVISVTDSTGVMVASDTLEVRAVFLTPANSNIEVGQTVSYSVSGGVAPYRWEVSNTGIASIDSTGLLRGIATGAVTVNVFDRDNVKMSATVTVVAAGSGGAIHPLDIRPFTAVLSRRSQSELLFTATGGTAPYRFSLTNTTVGKINASTGAYIPFSDAPGETRIVVTDADGHVAESGIISVQ
ncbi:MAG: S8 family serine peptidase [Gammaproteobacteria bacterium]|nr:S8 family serine peptidase [Gammaproteobacteria bacterium]